MGLQGLENELKEHRQGVLAYGRTLMVLVAVMTSDHADTPHQVHFRY